MFYLRFIGQAHRSAANGIAYKEASLLFLYADNSGRLFLRRCCAGKLNTCRNSTKVAIFSSDVPIVETAGLRGGLGVVA
jgi:hypothetical protein